MTEKLFYKDSHLSKFDAEVLSCVRAKRQQVKDSFGRLDGKAGEYYEIELDRTAFFPEGGGQYADTGVLYMADDDTCGLDETARKKVQVLDVRERNGRIFHITDGFIEAKTAVKGSIDWEERFMKMQQHTGEHIVSGLIHAAYGYNNVGFHLGSEDCTMDFDGEITEEELRRIEAEANKAVWKNLKVFTHYPKKEELSQIEYRSKIEIEGQVRIIEIPGYDCCACCAPHVTYTGEIGLIKLGQAQRYKGGVRITMLCGVRAFSDYVRKEAQAKEISRLLCAKENEIADAVSEKIGKSFMAIFIFVFVGMIIGTWMLSGTIPMLIYYGLKLLNPQLFLISAFVITVIVSVCTGTSFGSVGTVGLALIGVAQGLGVNLPAAAGAIISGAYFGDKMSPLSDTTNLAPVAAGTTLFEHIRHMFYTTVPAALVCLVVYFIAGRTGMVVSSVDASAANEMTEGLASIYHFNVFLLLPLVVVLVGSAMGKPTIPVMFTASVTKRKP